MNVSYLPKVTFLDNILNNLEKLKSPISKEGIYLAMFSSTSQIYKGNNEEIIAINSVDLDEFNSIILHIQYHSKIFIDS